MEIVRSDIGGSDVDGPDLSGLNMDYAALNLQSPFNLKKAAARDNYSFPLE